VKLSIDLDSRHSTRFSSKKNYVYNIRAIDKKVEQKQGYIADYVLKGTKIQSKAIRAARQIEMESAQVQTESRNFPQSNSLNRDLQTDKVLSPKKGDPGLLYQGGMCKVFAGKKEQKPRPMSAA